MSKPDDPSNARLHLIARILGVSVESFSGEPPPGNLADTAEYLRLWKRIRTDAGRAAALAAVRKIVADEGR